jgi:hypothetical protein
MGHHRAIPMLKEDREMTPERRESLRYWRVPDLTRNSPLLAESQGVIGISALLKSVDEAHSSRRPSRLQVSESQSKLQTNEPKQRRQFRIPSIKEEDNIHIEASKVEIRHSGELKSIIDSMRKNP